MKLLRGFKSVAKFAHGAAATIGNFDGVHLGHQALLKKLQHKAREKQLPMIVILFEPQPSEYFQGNLAPARLSSLREKLQVLEQLDIDYVYCLKFDKALSNMSAVDFAQKIIFSLLNVKYLLIGQDFRFGRHREGDFNLLKDLAVLRGCEVEAYADFLIANERVSSTKIRRALQDDKLQKAALLLGRPYSLCGRVVQGEGRGRQWGIPTANVRLQHHLTPIRGVFCVQVKRQGSLLFQGVANLGTRPTVSGKKTTLEVHLFDFHGTIYGEMLQVFFLYKLRDEVKFSSLNDLIEQIHKDIKEAKNYFACSASKMT